jgi:hypothetical protein
VVEPGEKGSIWWVKTHQLATRRTFHGAHL